MASGAGWAVTPRALPVAMDQMGRDARLALLASRQAGAFTFQQALTIGYPRATISRRITSGTWEKKHPGVYVIGGTAPSRLLDLWAGVLAVGSDGVLSHESSALIHGRSEEHTSELQSLMRISYAVFCLKKKHTECTPLVNTQPQIIMYTP